MSDHRTVLLDKGRSLRDAVSRGSHAAWKPPRNRPDPVTLLERSSEGRIQELIPVRYGRMMASPFAWYRGTALNMAADLANTPASGLTVQACGDAHLSNFGVYATPERRAIFDLNDFDETLPAPWEWDVKRLAASFVLACRGSHFDKDTARESVLTCVKAYREQMSALSEMRTLEVWYTNQDIDDLMEAVRDPDARQRALKRLDKARKQSRGVRDFPEYLLADNGNATIKEAPPLIFHWREHGRDELMEGVRNAFASYRGTLPEHRQILLNRFELVDIAIKVVGVGSVGTRCFILLLMASGNDPLYLQIKEARPSVLEPYAGKSAHANHGQRIVVGCQLMQSASDLFLGWTSGDGKRDYYVRQLKDMKLKPLVELFNKSFMVEYAAMCGRTLANAHGRSGEPAAITGYLGKSDRFDDAIASFAASYADQSERDYDTFMQAVRSGRLVVERDE
jgi:uncharacterized protein (DUF2252 family)